MDSDPNVEGGLKIAAGDEAEEESAPKRQKLEEGLVSQGEERDFDEETQKALEEIDTNQNEIDVLNEKASEEILKVEQKYNKLRRPFYDRRNEIIERIPKFWLTAFINHPQISQIIEEDEEDALQYLIRLEVEEFEDIKSGYRIKLHFDSKTNPYFENPVLTKEFLLSNGDPTSNSSPIDWREGHDLSAKFAMKTAAVNNGDVSLNNKRKKASSSSHEEQKSNNNTFFAWFTDNADPAQDDIAEVIKDDMWYVCMYVCMSNCSNF